ncbi:MAG: ABC transporter ATP-binding protein [Lachnospiraceae bacterium]|nr:ABC transporter ATP-binding protein [Lachnospiraceae bacterium]MDD3796192.1 ABC transporter ATP-binding protein [Lachnospiraceae bacterium]
MKSIVKHMAPYKGWVLGVFLLLIVQAWCDLSLPAYTSDIIDTGIQNSGVEHVIPQAVLTGEKELASLFMTEEEAEDWNSIFEEDGGISRRITRTEAELDALDEKLQMPLLLNYQLSAMTEDNLRSMISERAGAAGALLSNMSLEQIGALLGVELEPFERKQEDANGNVTTAVCVDVRPVLQKMEETGKMSAQDLLAMRDTVEKTTDTMGSSLLRSMGVAYAASCEEAAGIDLHQKQNHYLLMEGLKMVGLTLLMGIVTVIISFMASRVGAGVGRDLRGKVFKKVVGFSSAEMDQFSTASLITRCTNDVQQIQMVSVLFLRMVAYAPIMGIGGIVKVVQTGAGMTWVIALAVITALSYVMILMVIARPKFQLMQKLVDKVNLVSREILTGLSVIRAFGREQHEEKRFDEANKNLTRTMLFTNRVMTFMMPGMMLLMYVLSVGIVWVAAHRIDEGAMQVGAMTAFLTYAIQIVMSFLMLTMMSIMLPRAAVAAGRIDEILETKDTILDDGQPEKVSVSGGTLTFSHVNFKYPGGEENALEDIDFTAEPGKTTAIIGSTGCGKTTLVNLIPRLYDVTEGSILLDGVDIRKLPQKKLRDAIGFVPQKAVLFSGTIGDNLRFGKRDASEEELDRAAGIAQAAEFIDEKEERYESTIAQGGSNISGGQKQRLSIARALAKDAKVYVFDDSFSALDLKTDAALRKALEENMKDSTVILVAQRISTVLHAQQILVLDEGRIVGKGTHEELLKNCEVYEQIARSQLSAKELGIQEEKEGAKHE